MGIEVPQARALLALVVGIGLGVANDEAGAAISQASVTAPGGFVAAYAGMGNGSAPFAGGNFTTSYVAGDFNADEKLFAGGGASASASYSGPLSVNSASGFASFGLLGFQAQNNSSNSGFGQGTMNGGWTDGILIDAPGLTGQAGLWVGLVAVEGSLHGAGFAAAASFNVTAYKNGTQLRLSDAAGLFDPGSQWTPFSTDRQATRWAISTFGGTASMAVNDVATFVVPFVYGQAFDFGVYAAAVSGKRSSSGVAGNSTSDVLFHNTLWWAGTAGVLAGGAPVLDFSITSESGTNWAQAVNAVPLPAPVALLLAPLALVAARRRRI
ncbi:MAG: hypothetical protein AB7Q81_08095 [Gammaproteobacteria bacterium]